VRYLEENAAAAAITLSAAELEALDAVLPQGAAAGERYAAGGWPRSIVDGEEIRV